MVLWTPTTLQASSVLQLTTSVKRLWEAGAVLHAELTGPQAYDYVVIVESYYCLQEHS